MTKILLILKMRVWVRLNELTEINYILLSDILRVLTILVLLTIKLLGDANLVGYSIWRFWNRSLLGCLSYYLRMRGVLKLVDCANFTDVILLLWKSSNWVGNYLVLRQALRQWLALNPLDLSDVTLVWVIETLGLLLLGTSLLNILSLIDNVGYLTILPNQVIFFVLSRLVSSILLHKLHVAIVAIFVRRLVLVWDWS